MDFEWPFQTISKHKQQQINQIKNQNCHFFSNGGGGFGFCLTTRGSDTDDIVPERVGDLLEFCFSGDLQLVLKQSGRPDLPLWLCFWGDEEATVEWRETVAPIVTDLELFLGITEEEEEEDDDDGNWPEDVE